MKVNLGKTKVMVISGIRHGGLSKSIVDPCGVCSLKLMSSSVLCVQCGKWIRGRCAGVKRVTSMFSRNFTCRKCEGNIGDALEQEERLCDEMETVRKFAYLVDRVSAGGGCEASVTERTRCGWVKFGKCGELLYGRRFRLELKGAVYRSYVRPAILYESEAWCLKESEIEILRKPERSIVRVMCGVQLENRKRSTYLMFVLGLSETKDKLAMANSVRWYGHVLGREDGHVLRRTLDFEVDVQSKKGKLERTWIKQVEHERVKVGLRREDALC